MNGVPAVILTLEVRSAEGPLQAIFAAYDSRTGSAYHFLLLTPPGTPVPQDSIALLQSFRLLSPSEAARLRPRVIDVVAAGGTDSLASLAGRMASDRPLEHFLMLNQLTEADRLAPGTLVKIVRFAPATSSR